MHKFFHLLISGSTIFKIKNVVNGGSNVFKITPSKRYGNWNVYVDDVYVGYINRNRANQWFFSFWNLPTDKAYVFDWFFGHVLRDSLPPTHSLLVYEPAKPKPGYPVSPHKQLTITFKYT